MSASYRAAIIGCGKMSRGHSAAYQANPNVELVAGADVFATARDAFTAEFGVTDTFEDAAEMLRVAKPDLVSICTWPPLHYDLVKLALDHGAKGVWCEKPMTVHPDEAQAMVDAAHATGATLVINHQRRYLPTYNAARDLIAAGAIGEVMQITGIAGGDALTDGTHLIDLVRYLNHDDPVTSVLAAIDMSPIPDLDPNGMGTIEFNQTRKRYGHRIETGTLALLRFANGVRAHIELGSAHRGGYQRIFVEGTDGRIELSGDQPFTDGARLRLRRFDAGTTIPSASDLGPLSPKLINEQVINPMEGCLADLLVSIETGAPHRMSGDSSLLDFDVIMAIFESARQRRTITLPTGLAKSPLEEMLEAGEIPLN